MTAPPAAGLNRRGLGPISARAHTGPAAECPTYGGLHTSADPEAPRICSEYRPSAILPGPGGSRWHIGDTYTMTNGNPGSAQLDVTELLTRLAAAEKQAAERAGARSDEYRAGAADAYADVQALVRKLAGWPLEQDTGLTDS